MKRVSVVFVMVFALAITLVGPVQAYENVDDDPSHPNNQCQAPGADRMKEVSELHYFELPDFYEILPEGPLHTFFHQSWSADRTESEDLVSIDTDQCHKDLVIDCWTCLEWTDGPLEPVCAIKYFTKCVHRGHCDF